MTIKTHTLVIGGGPAGSTAARFLAKNGLDVILLERNLNYIKPCGGGLSINSFDEFEIPYDVIKKTTQSIILVSPSGKRLEINLKGNNLAIVERGEFDRILRLLAEKNGAKIINAELKDIKGKNRYEITAEREGNLYKIEAEYIVAADGVNSKTRTIFGLKPLKSFFTISEYISDISVDNCEFWFGFSHAPNAYSWVFPASNGISIGTGTFSQGMIHALFNNFIQRTGINKHGIRKVYRIPVWQGDLFNIDKVLFVGDSAGQVLPLTYEGIYYAMKSAEYAAQAIIDNKVNNYKKKWKSRFQKRFLLMCKLRDYFLKNDESTERLVSIHRRAEIQEASLRLWLAKESGRGSLIGYIKLIGNLLK